MFSVTNNEKDGEYYAGKDMAINGRNSPFQLIFLLLVFAVGVPLNVATFRRLLALHKTRRKGSSRVRCLPEIFCQMGHIWMQSVSFCIVKSLFSSQAAFVLLKLHLTLSDLMLLFFFVGPQLLWNLTYEWLLGDALCRRAIFFYYFSSFFCCCNIPLVDNEQVVVADHYGRLLRRETHAKKRCLIDGQQCFCCYNNLGIWLWTR